VGIGDAMMPPVTYREFYTQLLGASTYDQQNGPGMNLEDWLWESFGFADHGVEFVRHFPGYNGADHNRQNYLRIKGGAVEIPRYFV
jgi:hypothetical protein